MKVTSFRSTAATLMPSAPRTPATFARTVLLAIWFLPSACLVGFCVVGIALDESSGYLAFGFLPAAVLSVLSVIASYWVKRGTEKVARWIWVSHCLVLLGLVMVMAITSAHTPGLGVSTVLTYVMLIAAFPVSILVTLVGVGLAWLADQAIPSLPGDGGASGRAVEIGSVFLVWLAYVAAGYWQWFDFFPKIVSRFRMRRP